MKKVKVVWVTLSPELDDGSRKTLDVQELCSCQSRGTAELILYLLRKESIYGKTTNEKTAKGSDKMFLLSTM